MRILQLNLERGWRGGERQTLLTLRGLRAAGHEAELLARAGGPLARRARDEGFVVHEAAHIVGMAVCLLRRARRCDVLHAQTAQAMSLLALLRPCLRRPMVFTRRTAFGPTRHPGRTRWKWSRADAFVAISEAAAHAPRALGLEVRVIPSAVEARPADPPAVEALRARFALQGRTVLLTAAALSPEKDPRTLIEAVAILVAERPDLVCLHCGADGAAGEEARERIRALGLEDAYRLVGFQPRIEDFLALARVYVSSSRFEALGTSVLDACLSGVPVVATAVGGHLETLAQGRGLLCEPGDAEGMARQIARILDDPARAVAMARRAREHAARDYSVSAMVAGYLAVYRAL
ncbi:glycosyltransferase family 4 protein [Castellaniella sp. GW247-6E4]|uniref:glycosyltransferase family 4 protein n=1 Tax=Castellaniella sp. GW247-6E4 TaxID=3140380 RepID=UPI003315AF1B